MFVWCVGVGWSGAVCDHAVQPADQQVCPGVAPGQQAGPAAQPRSMVSQCHTSPHTCTGLCFCVGQTDHLCYYMCFSTLNAEAQMYVHVATHSTMSSCIRAEKKMVMEFKLCHNIMKRNVNSFAYHCV